MGWLAEGRITPHGGLCLEGRHPTRHESRVLIGSVTPAKPLVRHVDDL